jgi:hypothetical protein
MDDKTPTSWQDVAMFLVGAGTLCFVVWVIWR